MDWNRIWDILNKIAIVGTIIGIPATLYGIYTLIYNSIVVYDMYHEPNDAGGMTLCIGNFTRKDYWIGKKKTQIDRRVPHKVLFKCNPCRFQK